MFRPFLLGFAALVAAVTLLPDRADAQYSVYVFNHRQPNEGWQRSTRDRSINESLADCQKDIKARRLQAKRSKRDNESFAIAPGHAATIQAPAMVVYIPPKWAGASRFVSPIDPVVLAEETRRRMQGRSP